MWYFLMKKEFSNIETELNKITIYGNRTDEDIHKLGSVKAVEYTGETISVDGGFTIH